VASKTGNSYISGTVTDRMTIPASNRGFSTTPRAKKLTPGDCDNDRQPEMTIQTFCAPILQFLIVDRCRIIWPIFYRARHHRKSRTWHWDFDAICQSSRDLIISGFGGHIDIFGCRSLLYSLANTIFHLYMILNCGFVVGILTAPHIVSEI